MKYKITVTALFDSTDSVSLDKAKDGIVALQSKMKRINAIETSSIAVEKCYHDETPIKPCEVLYSWEKA